ncbi:hypothetical protein ES706_05599 [subsurface metagenome]
MLWLLILAVSGLISLALYLFKWRPYRKIVSFRGRLLNRVNLARRKRQLRSLGRTRFLDKVAARHSKSMARRKHCDHHGFNTRSALIKRKAGLSYIAENCYMFPASRYDSHVAKKLVAGWLKSPGHRANLLNPEFRRTGIGIIVRKGYVYATQIFTD